MSSIRQNFIKILILFCIAYCVPVLTMEQAEERSIELTAMESKFTSKSADDLENPIDILILPNELLEMILSYVYFDESACDKCQNIYEGLEKLLNIFKDISFVCKTFYSVSHSLKDKLREFYKVLLVIKFYEKIQNTEVGKFIITRNDNGVISKVTSDYFKNYYTRGGYVKLVVNRVILLLFYGANVNSKDKFCNTAMHQAVLYFNRDDNVMKDVIKILLAHGADVDIKNNNGDTPIAIARRSSSKELKELFGLVEVELKVPFRLYENIESVKNEKLYKCWNCILI